ncbi:hypothetical protein GCM10009827_027470 [Dactylosporangium maewongense]|uniref:Uncharacterized protein n=1 Tax=Dactylosporangium maewongense TaxID=634393 RepID=A0ABN2A5B2_9ACTN
MGRGGRGAEPDGGEGECGGAGRDAVQGLACVQDDSTVGPVLSCVSRDACRCGSRTDPKYRAKRTMWLPAVMRAVGDANRSIRPTLAGVKSFTATIARLHPGMTVFVRTERPTGPEPTGRPCTATGPT